MAQRIVTINDVSDGDETHRPRNPEWTVADPSIYLEKLAVQWLQARGDQVTPGKPNNILRT